MRDCIRIIAAKSRSASTEVWAGDEFLGTLHRDPNIRDIAEAGQIGALRAVD
jgi:hypothetical protein